MHVLFREKEREREFEVENFTNQSLLLASGVQVAMKLDYYCLLVRVELMRCLFFNNSYTLCTNIVATQSSQ